MTMPLPNTLFNSAFQHQRLNWLLISVIAIMVYLATFAMTIEAALSLLTITWDQSVENHMTVEIPALGDETSMPQPERIKQTLAVLHALPDIQSTAIVPDQETAKLLKPWISDPELAKSLPLPTLIDIEIKPGSFSSAQSIEERLKTVVSDASVDDHASWLSDLLHLIRDLTFLAAFMLFLSGAILFISINLICRAVMATEKDTIELLHTIGATDNDIARHFQHHARRLSWPGALFGFALATLTLGLLSFALKYLPAASNIPAIQWFGLALLTMMVPLVAVIGANLSARFSVLKLLHNMP